MTTIKLKLSEAATLALMAPALFALVHWIIGERPLVTEFEIGGVVGVVLLKTLEAFRAFIESLD